jgi:hypothetical protein
MLAEREGFFRCTVLLWELNTRDFLRQSDCQQVAAVGRREFQNPHLFCKFYANKKNFIIAFSNF